MWPLLMTLAGSGDLVQLSVLPSPVALNCELLGQGTDWASHQFTPAPITVAGKQQATNNHQKVGVPVVARWVKNLT